MPMALIERVRGGEDETEMVGFVPRSDERELRDGEEGKDMADETEDDLLGECNEL